jgi:hypothetical protein
LSKGSQNFLKECNAQHLPPQEFISVFCNRCRNLECVHSGWSEDAFGRRMSTQAERLLNNPNFAGVEHPKFAMLQEADFPNLLREAMRLEISARKGDWEIPEVPITDGQDETAKGTTSDAVDDAVRALAQARGGGEPDLPDRHIAEAQEFRSETEDMISDLPPVEVSDSKPPDVVSPEQEGTPHPGYPHQINTSFPSDGVMLDGSKKPKTKVEPKKEEADPWTVPEKPKNIVGAGARIRLGLDSTIEKPKDE